MVRRKQTKESFDEQQKIKETHPLMASLINDNPIAERSKVASEEAINGASFEPIEPMAEELIEPMAEDPIDPMAENREEPLMENILAKDIESLQQILSKEHYISSQITIRCRFKEICDVIKSCLSDEELNQFRKTQFAHLLDASTHSQLSSQLFWFFLLRQIKTNKEKEIWMMVNKIPMRFSMTEFALITGLKFSSGVNEEMMRIAIKENRLKQKYFEDDHAITVKDLKELLLSLAHRNDIDDDRLKLAVVLFVAGVVKGQDYNRGIDIKHLAMADDINLFDSCDWGVEAYMFLLNSIKKMDLKHKIEEHKSKAEKRRLSLTIYGFVHVFQTWAYELVPAIASKFAKRSNDSFPRILCWKTNLWKEKHSPEYKEIEALFQNVEIRSLLVPTEEERNFESISTALDLSDNEDSIIDELVRKLSMGAKIQHDSVVHRVNTPIPSLESRGRGPEVPIRATNSPKTRNQEVPIVTPETTQNCSRLVIDLKTYIDNSFFRMESSIKDYIRENITTKLDKLIAKQDIRCHCMHAEVVGDNHADSSNVNHLFDDLIADMDRREFYVTPPSSEINEVIEGSEIAPGNNFKPTEGIGRKRFVKPSALVQHPYTDPTKRRKFRRNDGIQFDPLREVSSSKLESFNEWMHNRRDNSISCTLGLRTKMFFNDIMAVGKWLHSEHIDEALYGVRKRHKKYNDIFDQSVVVLDEPFTQFIVRAYNERASTTSNNYKCDKTIMDYPNGKQPIHFCKNWKNKRALHMVLNVMRQHWVAIKADLNLCKLIVFDSNISATNNVIMQTTMEPLCTMIPIILKQTKWFGKLGNALETPWPYVRETNLPQNDNGDCALYAIKFIELDMGKMPFDTLNLGTDTLKALRKKMAVDIFHGDWDP